MSHPQVRVFVVEDHPMTARSLKMFLEMWGHEVEVAHDVASALRLAGKSDFDVLLCDLHLPDGTGWDLMAKLRKTKAVRGIAYSAFDESEYVARSKAAGLLEQIVKGSTAEELVAAIERALRGGHQSHSRCRERRIQESRACAKAASIIFVCLC